MKYRTGSEFAVLVVEKEEEAAAVDETARCVTFLNPVLNGFGGNEDLAVFAVVVAAVGVGGDDVVVLISFGGIVLF